MGDKAKLELRVGRTYRAKKPARAGWGKVNDRQIIWIGAYELQYDGPAVANGSHYPRVSIEKFREWADRDVTDELPAGDWADWPLPRKGKAVSK